MEIYIGTLERFGDIMLCIDKSPAKVMDAIMSKYTEIYENINKVSPKEQFSYDENKSDYDIAKENVYIRKSSLGEVELT